MQTDSTSSKRAPRASATLSNDDFSFTQLTDGLRDLLGDFDQHPVTFIKEKPMTAAIGAFFLGLILGSALSKRAVTK